MKSQIDKLNIWKWFDITSCSGVDGKELLNELDPCLAIISSIVPAKADMRYFTRYFTRYSLTQSVGQHYLSSFVFLDLLFFSYFPSLFLFKWILCDRVYGIYVSSSSLVLFFSCERCALFLNSVFFFTGMQDIYSHIHGKVVQ